VDPLLLIVTGRRNAQLDRRTTDRQFERQQETLLQLPAVRRDRVDLA
jgi:hypothetical protein